MLRVERLDARLHSRDTFTCGEASLDLYLRRQATQHHRDGIATTHVLVDDSAPTDILGYYALSAAQLLLTALTEQDRRRLPRYPVPAVRMARLAVASSAQGRGLGDCLLGCVVSQCLQLRATLGVRVLVVDALHARAAAFYRRYGFRETTEGGLTLYLPLGRADAHPFRL